MKTQEEIQELAKQYAKESLVFTDDVVDYDKTMHISFIVGYTQALQESNKRFTEEDIIKAIDIYRKEGLNVDKTLSENVEKLKTKVLELLTEYKQK